MLEALTTAYADTSAAQLRLELGLPPLHALADTAVPLSRGRVDLRLLGSSHQVLLYLPGPDGQLTIDCSETVACLPGGTGGLPARAECLLPAGHYSFRSSTRRCASEVLAANAAQLVARYGDQVAALVGRYPGNPDAITAMAVTPLPGAITWWSWHLYPQTGELVTTRTRLSRTPATGTHERPAP
jgi:uncharacterized protein DUF2617